MKAIALFAQAPWWQVPLFLVASLLVLVAFRPSSPNGVWTVTGLGYLAFILANSLLVLGSDSPWKYLGVSLLLTLGYLLIAGTLTSAWITLLGMKGPGETAMVFLFIIYHPPVLLLLTCLRVWWMRGHSR